MGRKHFCGGRLSKLQVSLIILSLAGSFIHGASTPVEASVNTITPNTNFGKTNVAINGNVTDVTTTKVINKTAINVFDKYQVSQGNVVNMWFGTKDSSSNANLVNLVNSKIDINGTVNAVQNKKIDGNMYFLSSEGIAVGAGGVINAGSLTLMTPTTGAMQAVIDGGSINETKLNEAMQGEIALNANGTITIAGQLNTHGNVMVATGKDILMGNTSVVNANVMDFSSLVNIEGVDSGLAPADQKLGAVATGEGNVTLLAQNVADDVLSVGVGEVSAIVTNNGTIIAPGNVNISAVASSTEPIVTANLVTRKYDAKVKQEGTVNAAGNVNIQAISNSYERLADKTAQIEVSGNVTGKRVNIAATSVNTFIDASSLNVIGILTEGIGLLTGLEVDADYSVVRNKAEVNIKDTAVITATSASQDDYALNISAGASVTASLGSSSSTLRLKRAALGKTEYIPGASVTYLESENTANVNVDGTLKSAGKTTVKAAALSSVETGASVGTVDLTQSGDIALVALDLTYGKNNAAVTIGNQAKLDKTNGEQNIKGALFINADASNVVSAKAEALGSTQDFLATAVNVVNYDSKAKVNINSAVTAPIVNIAATNNVTSNSIKTSNAVNDSLSGSFSTMFLSSKTFASIMDKLMKQELKVEGADTAVQKLKDYATVGISLGVANESFTSDVVLGNTANIQGRSASGTAGDVNIKATTAIADTSMYTTGTLIVDKKSEEALGVEAAVQVANLHNDSTITIEGGTKEQHAIVGGKNVSIAAGSTMEYNRPANMVKNAVKMAKAIAEVFKENSTASKSDLDQLNNYIAEMEKAGNDIPKMDYTADDLETQGGQMGKAHETFLSKCTVVGEWIDQHVVGLYDGVEGLYNSILAFTNPNSYSNFAAFTTNKGGGDKTKLSLSGSLNINHVYNNSNTLIGKNAALTAAELIDIKAASKAENVNFTGDAGSLFLPATTNGSGGGASVAVQLFDNNSLVMVGENANLRSDNINLEANDKLTQVGVVYSSGASQSIGIHGLVNYMGGSSSSVVSVDDEARMEAVKATKEGKLNINAVNDSTIVNVAGGFSKGSSISVGAGVAVTEYDISNYAVVGDNDADASQVEVTGDTDEILAANKVKKATKKAYAMANFANETQKTELLGSRAEVYQGELAGAEIGLKATTRGSINSVGVAGSVATESESKAGNVFDNILGTLNKGSGFIVNPVGRIANMVSNKSPQVADVVNELEMQEAGDVDLGVDVPGNNVARQDEYNELSQFHLSVAGSGAINQLTGDTATLIDHTKLTINSTAGTGKVQAEATDNIFAGAWAGAAAVNYVSATGNRGGNTSVGVSGAIGFNEVKRDVMTVVSNANILDAAELNLASVKQGAEVAAGLGASVSAGANRNNFTVAANASINLIDNNINAFLIKNTQKVSSGHNATNIKLAAESSDTQVAGGLNVSVATGGKGTSLGGGLSVVYAETNNDIASGIYGGTYNAVNNVTSDAVLATTQITAGVGVALANGSGQNAKSGALDGAIAITNTNNHARAVIDGAAITSTTVDGKVAVRAYDKNPGDSQYKDFLAKRGIEADGSSYVESAAKDTSATGSDNEKKTMTALENSGANTDYTGTLNTALGKTGEAGGNVAVTGAIAVAGTNGTGAGGIALGIADIDNDFKAEIKNNANVTAAMTEVNANNDSVVVNVVAGASGSSSRGFNFVGAGSVSVATLAGDSQARVSGSTINTDNLVITVDNKMVATNVAGQVSIGKVSTGMDFIWTQQDNTTKSELLGSTINPFAANSSVDIDIEATNGTKIYSVGVGTAISTDKAAVNGTMVINKGNSEVDATVDNIVDEKTKVESNASKLNKVKKVKVAASDKTVEVAIAAGVAAGKGVSLGGAIAYNDVDGSSAKTGNAKQKLKAAIKNSALTTVTDATIQVEAKDNANTTAVGFGVAASNKVAVQGSSAVSLINKQVTAAMEKVTITKDVLATNGAAVTVDTSNFTKIANAGVVIAASGKVGVGAGIAVNRVNEDSKAEILDSSLAVKSAVAQSLAQPEILNIGIGIGAGGSAGIAGSFGVNLMDSNTAASINNSTIIATGNVGAIAQSDDIIGNYAGSIGGAGTGAAALSVTVNNINGSTKALVQDSIIEAKGKENESITVKSEVKDEDLNKGIVSKESWGAGVPLKNKRQSSSYKGLVVDASSTHYIHSDIASVGGAGTFELMGSVNVNSIGGSTSSEFIAKNKGSINNDTSGGVFIKAADFTNAAAFVGEAGGSGTAAIGLASDAEVLERNVTASLTGISTTNRLNLAAGQMKVEAVSKQGISSLLVGAQGSGVAAVAAGVSAVKLKGTTKASIVDVNANNTSLQLGARHYSSTGEGNNNFAGSNNLGVGATVSVITVESAVETELKNSKVHSAGEVRVAAEDKKVVLTENVGLGLAFEGVGAAANVAVNNFENTVKTTVMDSDIYAQQGIDIGGVNSIEVSANGGTLGGAAVGLGVGVVVNTINTGTGTEVSGSVLETANKNVVVHAEEMRKVDGITANVAGGIGGIGVNIFKSSVGRVEDGLAGNGEDWQSTVNAGINEAVAQANLVQTDGQNGNPLGNTRGLTANEKTTLKSDTNATATKGTGNSNVHATVTGGRISAVNGEAKVTSNIINKGYIGGGGGTGGIIGVNVSVNSAEINNNLYTTVKGTDIKAKNVNVDATIGGTEDNTKVLTGQGSIGGLNVHVSSAQVYSKGAATVTVTGADISAIQDVKISSKDLSSVDAEMDGIAVGIIDTGNLQSDAENTITTQIDMGGAASGQANKIKAGNSIGVSTERKGKVKAYTLGGGNGGLTVANVTADAKSEGKSAINVLGSGSSFTAPNISMRAINNPVIEARVFNESGAIFTIQVANATSEAILYSDLSIANDNSLLGDLVELEGSIGTKDTTTNKATTRGVGVGGIEANPNTAKAQGTTKVNVTVGKETYKQNQAGAGLTTLDIAGTNNFSQEAATDLVSVGAVISVANSAAEAAATNTITVNAKEGGKVKDLVVLAQGDTAQVVNSWGDGGGVANISPYAANSTSNINNTTTANIGGTWDIAGQAKLSALQKDKIALYVDTDNGGVVNIAGAYAKNNLTDTTKLNFSKDTTIKADSVYGLAQNSVVNNEKENTAEGVAGGLGAGNNISSEANITTTAEVDLDSARVVTDNSQTYEAYTEGSLKNNVKATSGGLLAGSTGASINSIQVTNKVSTAAGSVLNVKKHADSKGTVNSITMAASDDLDLTAKVTANTGGGIAGVTAKSDNNTIRRANIDVAGTVYSAGDTNLYAGAAADGSSSQLDASLEANAYTYAVIPIPLTDFHNKVEEYNQVQIADTGKVNSIRNVNIIGSSGKEALRLRTVQYTWYSGNHDERTFVGNANGVADYGQITDNYVKVEGAVQAGLENNVTITLSGKKAPKGATFEDGSQGGYTITVDSGEYTKDLIREGITEGSFNYSNALFARYEELNKLIAEYQVGADDNWTAYYGYKNEQASILNQMLELGMVELSHDESGKPVAGKYNPIKTLDLNYIALPDIVVSGGNIVISSDNLGGSGSLQTEGSPKITVDNTSDAYLKVGNLTIGDDGGRIIYKDQDIAGKSSEEVNKLNVKKDFAKFSALSAGDSSTVSAITLTTKYDGGNYIVKADPAYYDQIGQSVPSNRVIFSPITTIELNGLVTNESGIATINNRSGSINIQAGGNNDKAGVVAKEVNISATGSINQGFVEGIVNIGLTPEVAYKDFVKGQEAAEDKNIPASKKIAYGSLPTASGDSARIAGGSVYISASNINVNGIVQSGYNSYYATIAANALEDLSSYSKTIVNGVSMYKLNDGGKSVYNSSKKAFDYIVQVYYDPSSQKIFVEDIQTSGGNIYLTGNISSTGNGSLIAANGGSEINITNNTSAGMDVGSIVNSNREGKIVVTDLFKSKQTIFTPTTTSVTDLKGGHVSTEAAKNSYETLTGLRYNWTDGSETTTRKIYEKVVENSWWGAGSDRPSGDQLKHYEQSTTPTSTENPQGEAMQSGTFIGKVDAVTDNSKDYALIYDNIINGGENRSDVEQWTSSSGFFGFYKHHHYRWTVTQGTTQTYVNSIKADSDISVKFIGGDGNINVYGGSDVNLQGNIIANSALSKTNVTAVTGSINQAGGSFITSNNVNLTAEKGINNINIISQAVGGSANDLVNLKAETAKGSVDVAVAGGIFDNQHLPGNVNIISLKGDESASLTAAGTITQAGNGLTVKADRLQIVSLGGAIGTDTQDVIVEAGQNATGEDGLSASISAAAVGDINLAQHSGDMRIGKIASTNGNVNLKSTDGKFIDALPNEGSANNGEDEAKIQNWKDMGLIAGDGLFTETLAQDRKDYKVNTEAAFVKYQELKAYYGAHQDESKTESYKQLDNMFNNFTTVDEYLAQDSKYQKLMAEPEYGWTESDLLYSVKDAIINKTTGSTDNEKKAANISGKSVILTGKGVGTNDAAPVVLDLDNLTEDDLKLLSNANAADVDMDLAKGTAVISGKRALGVNATQAVTLNVSGDAYISSRSLNGDATGSGPVLTINKIDAAGNVRIMGKQGVVAADAASIMADIKARGLYIEGGTGDIGTAARGLQLDIAGTTGSPGVSAITGGSIYLRNVGLASDFYLGTMYAGKELLVDADKANIYMSSLAEAAAYLRTGDGNIKLLTTGGAIGTEDTPVRVYNGAANKNILDVTSEGNIYLKGMNGADSNGTMSIKKVDSKAGAVGLTSEGTLIVGKEDTSEAEQDGFTGTVSAANDVSLTATGDIVLDGAVTAGRDKTVTLTSKKGALKQLDKLDLAKAIHAQKLVTSSAKEQNLQNVGNNFSNLSFKGSQENSGIISGNVAVNTKAAGSVILDGNNTKVDGTVLLTNSEAGAGLNINTGFETLSGHSIDLTVDGLLNNNGVLKSDKDVKLQSMSSNVINSKSINAQKGAVQITANNGSINIGGQVDALTDIGMSSKSGITTDGMVTAGGDIVQRVIDDGTIVNKNGITAGGNLTEELMGKGDLVSDNIIQAGQDLRLITHDGSVTVDLPEAANVAKNLYINANNGDANVRGSMEVGDDIIVEATKGNINFSGLVVDETDTSNIRLKATDGNINNNVKIITAGNIFETVVNKGNITNEDFVIAGGDVYQFIDGDGNIDDNGSMAVGGNLTKRITGTGDVIVDEMLTYVKGDISFSTNKGSVKVLNDIPLYSQRGTITLAAFDGNILANTIDGENVNIKLGTSGRTALVGATTVGTKLSFEGSNFIDAKIQQRDGYTNPLHISAVGIQGKQPMDNFILPEVIAPNGLVMDKLWSKTAYVNIDVPELKLEEVNIVKNGYFFTPKTSATIYGPKGSYDRFNNIQTDSVQASTVNNPWVRLYLYNNGTQFSDAALLYKVEGQKVYNQRFSAVDESLRILTEETPTDMYREHDEFNYPGARYGTYWRYDLVDGLDTFSTTPTLADIVILP